MRARQATDRGNTSMCTHIHCTERRSLIVGGGGGEEREEGVGRRTVRVIDLFDPGLRPDLP